jgi:hypothetical protein
METSLSFCWIKNGQERKKKFFLYFRVRKKCFECQLFISKIDFPIFHHFPEEESEELLEQKRKLLGEYIKIDPLFAEEDTNEYWTCWLEDRKQDVGEISS